MCLLQITSAINLLLFNLEYIFATLFSLHFLRCCLKSRASIKLGNLVLRLSWKRKLATIEAKKADTLSVCPSSEWLRQHYSCFRNLPLSSIKLVGDHFLYTCDINVWFRGDIIRKYKTPVIILNYNNLKLYSLL